MKTELPDCRTQREFLKDKLRLLIDFNLSDQSKDVPMPPVQKAIRPEQEVILLPAAQTCPTAHAQLDHLLQQRFSQRRYKQEDLSLAELAWLLWATQGVRKNQGERVLRTAPSAGNRHCFETYIAVFQVEGLAQGIYRYLPLEHALVLESQSENLAPEVAAAALGQDFAAKAAVCFFWTALPYRCEWRYRQASVKVIALDAGHVCQNLYLAAEAINCGCCALAAYEQDLADHLLQVDGTDEFTIYLASVGKSIVSREKLSPATS